MCVCVCVCVCSENENVKNKKKTVSDIDAAVAELKAKGAEFTMEPTTIRPNVRIAFLRGPQNVSVELIDRNAA